ncbi:MAG: pyrroloquinoline quinone biosynthesis protein PqqB [Bryobacteraceae bacterium]
MYVRVLGAAAGGGFPQWNCSCGNCRRLRQGNFQGPARSQAQLAISADPENWFLVNASPDLRYQIESCPFLRPTPHSFRNCPIKGVVLTSAELDASLGLLLLRESHPLVAYATEPVRRLLTEDNAFFNVFRRVPDQLEWQTIVPGEPFQLQLIRGAPVGIQCSAVSSSESFPGYASTERVRSLDPAGAVIGLFLQHGSKRIAFFPGAPRVAPEWLQEFAECEVIFFDGTFWSDDELIRIQGQGKTAREMGHSPVGGPGGTLEQFETLAGPRKIFIHVNNTNPMLDEETPEYHEICDAGWELAFDGMEIAV